jgi:hypothetical protein
MASGLTGPGEGLLMQLDASSFTEESEEGGLSSNEQASQNDKAA